MEMTDGVYGFVLAAAARPHVKPIKSQSPSQTAGSQARDTPPQRLCQVLAGRAKPAELSREVEAPSRKRRRGRKKVDFKNGNRWFS